MFYKKILCANDLTNTSEAAMSAALHLGRELDVPVVVLHVAELPYPRRDLFGTYSAEEEEMLVGIARREVEAALKLLREQIDRLNPPGRDAAAVETVVRQGVPIDTILAVTREIGADLIVCGTHARKGIQHALLGSVAERLVRTAPCAVHVARTPA
jgi:nucleotide-binding universal stress UspA family protein